MTFQRLGLSILVLAGAALVGLALSLALRRGDTRRVITP